MASLFFTCSLAPPRGLSNCSPILCAPNITLRKDLRPQKWPLRAAPKKGASKLGATGIPSEGSNDKAPENLKPARRRGRKKISAETLEEEPVVMAESPEETNTSTPIQSAEGSKKVARRGRKQEDPVVTVDNPEEAKMDITVQPTEGSKKVAKRGKKNVTPAPSSEEDFTEKKVTKRRTRKKVDMTKDQSISVESGNHDESVSADLLKVEEEILLGEDEGEDISFTYSWPPLVCCFGAAHHAFIPSGRPANRLIDHEIHKSMKDMFWSPTKFVRAPGGSASNVAISLVAIGGRAEFMGKLGDDEYGQTILYHLNDNKVQTRSVKLDPSKPTALSHMKIIRRGGMRANCVKACAEDSFLRSEIHIDVLKEAKMLYFNSLSLLDPNMRSTTMETIRISKKFGGVVFFDLNLPLPLWNSYEETKTVIQLAWNSANIIEVTKQELEFLCQIPLTDTFDDEDNNKSKFIHHKPEVIMPLWHENLKVLFVTNGTSKIHYYTANDNGWVHGMEDAPISPFTGDMSVSGDAVVAALMRMLTVQPHLATDKHYLEHMIKYAINCGVIDQWLYTRSLGFPPKERGGASSSGPGEMRFVTEREYRTVDEVEELSPEVSPVVS